MSSSERTFCDRIRDSAVMSSTAPGIDLTAVILLLLYREGGAISLYHKLCYTLVLACMYSNIRVQVIIRVSGRVFVLEVATWVVSAAFVFFA